MMKEALLSMCFQLPFGSPTHHMRQGIYQSSALQRRLLGAEPEAPASHLMIVRSYTEITILPANTFESLSKENGCDNIGQRFSDDSCVRNPRGPPHTS